MKLDLKKINFRTLMKARRFLFFSIGTVAAATILAGYTFAYQLPQAIQTKLQLDQQKVVLAGLQRKVTALQDVQYLKEFQNKEQVDLALPSSKPLLELLASANQAAQQSQVTLGNIETSPGKLATGSAKTTAGSPPPPDPSGFNQKIGGIDSLQIGLRVTGTLPQINAFLDQMEKITPITDITQIQLETANTAGSTGQFSAKLLLTTFYFTQSIRVAIDAPLPEIQGNEETFLQQLSTFTFPTVGKSTIIQGGQQDLFGVNRQGVLQQ